MPIRRNPASYQMQALADSGIQHSWISHGEPDFEGVQSPEPLRSPRCADVAHTYHPRDPWTCEAGGAGISSEDAHERDPMACDLEKVRQVMEA